ELDATLPALTGALEGEVETPFPMIASSAVTETASTATSFDLNMPSGVQVGDLLIAFLANDVGDTPTLDMSGWEELYNTRNGTAVRGAAFARVATGTDPVSTAKDNQDLAAVVVRIVNHGVENPATDIHVATPATGSSNAPNPPDLD